MANSRAKITLLLVGLTAVLTLTGCGKRATRLETPTEDVVPYPAMYPDPATDPKPVKP